MPLVGAPAGRRRPPPPLPSALSPNVRLSPPRRLRRWAVAAAARVRGYHKAPPPPGTVVAALWAAAAIIVVVSLCAAQAARRVRVAEAGLAGEVLGELRTLAHVRGGVGGGGGGGDGGADPTTVASVAVADAVREGRREEGTDAATGAVAAEERRDDAGAVAADDTAAADDTVAADVAAAMDSSAAAEAAAASGDERGSETLQGGALAAPGGPVRAPAKNEGDVIVPPPHLDEVPTPASLCGSLTPASPPPPPCGLSALSRSPGLAELLYSHPARLHAEVLTSPTGAIRLNRAHDGADAGGAAAAAPFYLEFQHHGGDFVAAGLALNAANLTLLRAGLFTLDWGVRALRGVSAFEVGGGGDARHSVTFFFEAAARAALLLRDAGVCAAYRRQRLEPLLRRLAVWAADVDGDSFKYQVRPRGEEKNGKGRCGGGVAAPA